MKNDGTSGHEIGHTAGKTGLSGSRMGHVARKTIDFTAMKIRRHQKVGHKINTKETLDFLAVNHTGVGGGGGEREVCRRTDHLTNFISGHNIGRHRRK